MKSTTALALAVVNLALCSPAWTQDEVHDLVYLSDFLKEEPYRRAWDEMLKGVTVDAWITRYSKVYDGVESPVMPVQVEGETYRIADVCKPHDCGNNSIHVLFSPDGQHSWGLVKAITEECTKDATCHVIKSRFQWLGHPNAGIQKAITDECTKDETCQGLQH